MAGISSFQPYFQHTQQNPTRQNSSSPSDISILAHSSLVPQDIENVPSTSCGTQTQKRKKTPPSSSKTTLDSSTHAKSDNYGSSFIRKKLKRQGLSKKVIKTIVHSWKSTSAKQYKVYLDKWDVYCHKKNIDPLKRNLIRGLDFLQSLITAGYSYSAINTARSALSCIFDSPPFGEEPLVQRLLKGAYNINPPLPRYNSTWDVSIVLKTLESWGPGRFLSRKQLTFKLVTLLALVTGQRAQTLQALDINLCQFDNNCVTFTIHKLLKHNTAFNTLGNKVIIPYYDINKKICPAVCLKQYMKRTKRERSSSQLFIGLQTPFLPISTSTISRWIKLTLGEAGIDTSLYKSHSTRAASTSAASKSLDISYILKAASWKKASTFRRYYHRNISSESESVRFGAAVLDTT